MSDVSSVVSADDATRTALLAVEDRRIRALLAADIPALDDLFDDSLVHTHAPAVTHDKSQLLEHVATRQAYVGIERGELLVRVLGDVAIMTGRITNTLRNPDGSQRVLGGQVIQVLRRCPDGAWRFVSFQLTPDGEQVWSALPSEREPSEREPSEHEHGTHDKDAQA